MIVHTGEKDSKSDVFAYLETKYVKYQKTLFLLLYLDF